MTSLIIYGGTVLLPEGKQLPNAVVVCKNNHIHEILQNDDQLLLVESVKHFLLQPKSSEKEGTDRIFSISDSEVFYNASGLFVSPGLIDPHTHISLQNEGVNVPLGSDVNESTNPVTPYLRAVDAIYHDDPAFEAALTSGVTTVAITPGSNNVIGGQVAVVKTRPGTLLNKLERECAAVKMSLGENPKITYGPAKFPSTRMSIAYLVRQALVDAQFYKEKMREHDEDTAERDEKRRKIERKLVELEAKLLNNTHAKNPSTTPSGTTQHNPQQIEKTVDTQLQKQQQQQLTLLREVRELEAETEYTKAREEYMVCCRRKCCPVKRDMGLEALGLLLDRKIPAKIHCHRADDIITATRICKEFSIDFTLDHCSEGHLVADYLGQMKAKCIIGPVLVFRGKNELKHRTETTAAVLKKAGAIVSLTTDHPVIPIQNFLLQMSIFVSRGGLSLDAALDCVTENAAQMIGMQDRIGRIQPGFDADFAIMTARPGEAHCKVVTTIIDGTIVWHSA